MKQLTVILALVVGCVRVVTAQQDDFNRPTLNPWTIVSGSVGLVSGDLALFSSGMGLVQYATPATSADQFSEVIYSRTLDARVALQVFVRRRASDLQRYGCHYNPRAGFMRWEIKLDGGPNAPMIGTGLFPAPAPGDTLRIEAEGPELRCYHNGALVVAATNGVLMDTGTMGIVMSTLGVSGLPYPLRYVDAWIGGSLP